MKQELAVQLLAQVAELRAIVDTQRSGWFTLGAAGLGGLFGLLASWIPIAWRESRRRKHDAQTIRASLVAEISAMTEIIRGRRYVEALTAAAAEVKKEQTVKFSVNVPADYFIVYKSNTSRMGLLDAHDAARIVYLYQLLESVVQDVTPGGILAEGLGGPEAFQEAVAFLERALEIADDLVAKYGAIPD